MKSPILILGATTPIGLGVVQAAVESGRPVIAVGHDEAALAALAGAFPTADLRLLPASVKDDAGAAALARTLHDLDRPLGGVVAALCNGTERGRLLEASRDTPAGRLDWRITVRDDGQRLFYGALPTLIEWGATHPADEARMRGVTAIRRASRPGRPRSTSRTCSRARGAPWCRRP